MSTAWPGPSVRLGKLKPATSQGAGGGEIVEAGTPPRTCKEAGALLFAGEVQWAEVEHCLGCRRVRQMQLFRSPSHPFRGATGPSEHGG